MEINTKYLCKGLAFGFLIGAILGSVVEKITGSDILKATIIMVVTILGGLIGVLVDRIIENRKLNK